VNQIIHGDSLLVLPTLPADSFDACVTDPPYELGFMAKKWDGTGIAFSAAFWSEVFRVMKPGGHLVAFGGTRTYHRMACAIEDAGFEIRDQLAWVYGSGFPKSSNQDGEWAGYGTALKPAWEPIVLARKPLIGTVAKNLAAHRTGALNIDGCRVGTEGATKRSEQAAYPKNRDGSEDRSGCWARTVHAIEQVPLGRWPANLCHDGSEEVLACFPNTKSGKPCGTKAGNNNNVFGQLAGGIPVTGFGDSGSAARFFYSPKATSADRDAGLEDFTPTRVNDGRETPIDNAYQRGESLRKNTHPTVKPTGLMRWLCRLITHPGGRILDPFLGSGSTGRAAAIEGFAFTGIEREAEYVEIARARIGDVGGLFSAVVPADENIEEVDL
jgi:site-specific DNA-methyltransferase (adenine-specific)